MVNEEYDWEQEEKREGDNRTMLERLLQAEHWRRILENTTSQLLPKK